MEDMSKLGNLATTDVIKGTWAKVEKQLPPEGKVYSIKLPKLP